MWQGIPDICRDHRHLTTCQKQHRQNEPAGQVDIPTWVEVHVKGIPDICRDHRCFTTCQKQHRQNEPAGQVGVATVLLGWWSVWLGILDTCRDHRHLTACQKQHRQNETAGQVDVPTLVEVHVAGIWTHLGNTDVSPSVKNNTERMNQLVG